MEAGNHGRVSRRIMVVYEGTKEVLAIAHYSVLGAFGRPDCFHFRFGSGSVHLHFVLVRVG